MNKKIWIILATVLIISGALYWNANRSDTTEVDLGEEQEEQVMCSQDVKECPGGTFVSRVAPSCDFAACPEPLEPVFEDGTLPPDTGAEGVGAGGKAEVEATFCTMDAKICPDGSYVGRIPPTCEFAACP